MVPVQFASNMDNRRMTRQARLPRLPAYLHTLIQRRVLDARRRRVRVRTVTISGKSASKTAVHQLGRNSAAREVAAGYHPTRRGRQWLIALLLGVMLLGVLVLSGCGQKGPLYLPPAPGKAVGAGSADEATPAPKAAPALPVTPPSPASAAGG